MQRQNMSNNLPDNISPNDPTAPWNQVAENCCEGCYWFKDTTTNTFCYLHGIPTDFDDWCEDFEKT